MTHHNTLEAIECSLHDS